MRVIKNYLFSVSEEAEDYQRVVGTKAVKAIWASEGQLPRGGLYEDKDRKEIVVNPDKSWIEALEALFHETGHTVPGSDKNHDFLDRVSVTQSRLALRHILMDYVEHQRRLEARRWRKQVRALEAEVANLKKASGQLL
jgi:hypothetical protein